ncbi:hypothetical protein [Algihabitans albus]|uniref:hypothetical protein n=1 Tax=Algihabitans albus TaxID=2164067 RepID=UPI0013C2FA10|nr:hypothetical protein [Algihabitans albus]
MSRSTSGRAAGWPALRVIEGGLSSVSTGSALQASPFGDGPMQARDLAVDLDTLAGLAADELAVLGRTVDSPALSAALEALAGPKNGDVVTVPREPDALMIATGAAVAGVDRATAERIYRAMVRLAE